MDKSVTTELFTTIASRIEGMTPAEAYQHLGAAVGLVALAIEREHGVDRNSTFKMVQRYGHDAIKQLEQSNNTTAQ